MGHSLSHNTSMLDSIHRPEDANCASHVYYPCMWHPLSVWTRAIFWCILSLTLSHKGGPRSIQAWFSLLAEGYKLAAEFSCFAHQQALPYHLFRRSQQRTVSLFNSIYRHLNINTYFLNHNAFERSASFAQEKARVQVNGSRYQIPTRYSYSDLQREREGYVREIDR